MCLFLSLFLGLCSKFNFIEIRYSQILNYVVAFKHIAPNDTVNRCFIGFVKWEFTCNRKSMSSIQGTPFTLSKT